MGPGTRAPTTSIILFSSLWGIALKEWRGSSARTHQFIFVGIAILILSTLVVDYGNFLGGSRVH